MEIHDVTVPGLSGALVDLDINSTGRLAYICKYLNGYSVFLDGEKVDICQGVPYDIRLLSNDAFVLFCHHGEYIDRYYRLERYQKSAHFGWHSNWSWSIDPQYENITCTDRWIVVGFSDMNRNGVLAIPDLGHSLVYYKDIFLEEAVRGVEIYAMCKGPRDSIYFHPYTDFQLVQWNLDTMTQVVWETPEAVHGSNAVSITDGTAYFYSPYDEEHYEGDEFNWKNVRITEIREHSFYSWEIGSSVVKKVGEYKLNGSTIRGLPGGRFLVIHRNSYSIISF